MNRSAAWGFLFGGSIMSILFTIIIGVGGGKDDLVRPAPPAAITTGGPQLLAAWDDLKEGVSVIQDEKNGNLIYVGAVGWAAKSYSISVAVIPISKAEEQKK